MSVIRFLIGAALCASTAHAQGPNILLFTKSSAAHHFVVRTPDDTRSIVDLVVSNVAAEFGGTVTASKDGAIINATDLSQFDAVIFFTSGDLTTLGTDGEPPVSPSAVNALIDYVEAGGGFVGFHAVSDTFHPESPDDVSPFLEFLGGEFDRHGSQFVGTIRKAREYHPLLIAIPDDWALLEEWYRFKNYALDDATVVALFDPGDEGTRQSMYDVAPYPLFWVKEPGDGRLAHIQLAHNEATWNDADFQQLVSNAIRWVSRTLAPGDTDGSGALDSVDIQRVINTVLGLDGSGFAVDLDGNGVVNAVDVQSVINAVLAGS